MAETKKTLKSPLLNKKVEIALILQASTTLYKNRDQATLLIGASKDFTLPVDSYGNLIDPLTDDEREWLENKLKIDLSIHTRNTPDNPKANFWTTKKARVKLTKTASKISSASVILDLNNPHQFIHYKIAKVCPRVANTWAERYDRRDYEFVIKDGKVELEVELKILDIKDNVLEYLLKNKKSKKKLFDLVRLHGGTTSRLIKFDSDTELIYNELRKISDTKQGSIELHNIITLGEKDMHSKVILVDAVTIGLIEKRGWEYTLKNGEKIGNTTDEAISYIENVKNQSVKMRLEQEIEKFYKK